MSFCEHFLGIKKTTIQLPGTQRLLPTQRSKLRAVSELLLVFHLLHQLLLAEELPGVPLCASNLICLSVIVYLFSTITIQYLCPERTAGMEALERRETYKYTPLPGLRHIRIVRLRSGNYPDLLRCDILERSLDEAPVYEALSYTWGDNKDLCTLSCDGKWRLSITSNLEDSGY